MPTRLTLLIAAAALALGLAQSPARALDASSPPSLVNSLVSDGLGIVAEAQASDGQRQDKFRALLDQGFDIPRISRFVLGRFWNGATDEQRQTFNKLFEDWVVQTYSSRFKSYQGQTIKVTGTSAESETTTLVSSQLVNPNGAPPAQIDWHVHKNPDGGYRIVDVSVDGVSMALTQRDENAAIADRNGGTIVALNNALQQKLASGQPMPSALPATK